VSRRHRTPKQAAQWIPATSAGMTRVTPMPTDLPMPASQRIVQVCLFLFAAIALSGGALQMYLGQPETTPRLDNVHRFLAGIYLGCGLICLWAAITVRRHSTLVLLIGLAVFLAGCGRLLSIGIVG